jgi:hypothetical protein
MEFPGGDMSQRIMPYWVGNVAHLSPPPRYLRTGPNDTANQWGSPREQKPLAKVLPLIAAKKKDVPQP